MEAAPTTSLPPGHQHVSFGSLNGIYSQKHHAESLTLQQGRTFFADAQPAGAVESKRLRGQSVIELFKGAIYGVTTR